MSLEEALARGLDKLALPLPAAVQAKLLAYLALIEKWNRTYSLTAVRDPQQMVTHHLVDSLAVVPHLAPGPLADVGSGAGLPGIPIALAQPQTPVTLIDSNHKKSAFLRQAVIELGLANAEVVSARVETWHPQQRFQTVISRAFSDLSEFVTLAGGLCAREGVMAAMKGVHPYEELAQLPPSHRVLKVQPLSVPGLDAERHLILIGRAA